MGAEIDRLEVQVEVQADKANKALEALADRLEKIGSSLAGISKNKLTGFAEGIEQIANASTGLSQIKTADFSRLANSVQKASGIDSQRLTHTGYALSTLAKSINKVGNVTQNTQQISEMAKGIGKFGYKSVSQAIDNMPKLASAMNELMETLSKAPAVSDNLIQMTNALANFTSNVRGVKGSSQRGSSSVNKLSEAFGILAGNTKKTSKSVHSFSRMAGKLYTSVLMISRGIKKAMVPVESSMGFLETVNYFEVAMRKIGDDAVSTWDGKGYESAEAYAQSFSQRAKQLTAKMTGYEVDESGNATYTGMKNLGMNPDSVMQWQAVYAQMTDSLGLAEESTLQFSDALTMLGADWASLRNLDFETAWNKFASALSGQSRAVRSLGIDITNATLQEYAYKYGLEQSITEMNQATKAQLRLLAILDQSEVAYGDLANTIASPSNQLRILKENFENLSRSIGNIFLPIVEGILPYINGMVIALQELFAWVGNLLGVEFGSINSSMGGMSDEMADMLEDAEGYGDSLDDAAGSAKKLKNNLQGWNELNNIAMQDSAASDNSVAVGNGSAVLDDAIAKAVADYRAVWDEAFARMENTAQEFADKLAGWAKNVYDAITPFREAVIALWDGGLSKLAGFTWSALGDFYRNFLVPMGEWAFGDENTGITRLVKVVNEGLMTVDWDAINESLRNFWAAIEPYAEQFGEGLIDFFEKVVGIGVDVANGIPGFLDNLAAALNNGDPEVARAWGEALPKLILGLMAFKGAASIIKSIADFGIALKTIGEGLSVIGKVISTMFKPLTGLIGKIGEVIALVSGGAGTIGEALSAVFSPLQGIIAIVAGLALAVTNFIDMFKNGFNALKEVLMVLGIALAAVGAVILGVPAAIAAVVAAIVAAVATIVIVVKEHWNEICEFFAGIGEWINENVIQPVVEFFRGFWEKVSGFFKSLWEDICAIWIAVSDWFSENVIDPIVGFFQGFGMRIRQIFEGLWIIIQAVWQIASTWFNENVIMPIVGFFQHMWESISGFFAACWEDICTMWSTVSEWFNENVIKPVVGSFQEMWKKISGFFSNLWDGIKDIWKNVSEWFSTYVIEPVQRAWKTATEAIARFFSGLWDGIKLGVVNAMNAVIEGIEDAINLIVRGINTLIGGFNKIVSWAAAVIGEDWGGVTLLNEVTLTRVRGYANGGYPETGQLFMARENGINEMVGKIGNRSAVANNDDIVQAVAYGVSVANEETNELLKENNQLLMAILQKEGGWSESTTFKSVRNSAYEFYKRTGRSPFPV